MTRDLALGLVLVAVAAAYYALADAIPAGGLSDQVGPSGLPKVYAALLALIGSVQVVRGWMAQGDGQPVVTRPVLLRVAGLLSIGILYVVIVPWAGYPVTIALLLVGTACYQGGRFDRRVVVVGVLGALVFWVVFVQVLGIDHPPGAWVERFIGQS